MLHSEIVQKWGSHFRPPFEHFWGPQKSSKIDPGLIFRGLGGGPKNGAPSRAPKSGILLLFTTLELGPTSQKGTPFWSHFGDLFCQKNGKRGFQKRPKNQSQKTFKMGPKLGGGAYFTLLVFFWALKPARTHFAAGTLLDLHFSLFWRHCSCISV